ncbi:MAG: T9SS type A sorting domain-containing protein [Bacteroidales bacterium]|nr:T9SS type A sorting domain-containing protein [Bacteroidales bacterium]
MNIYNLLGQKIYQTNKYKINQVSQQNILSYFNLTKGIYFISIQHNNTIQVKKIYIY